MTTTPPETVPEVVALLERRLRYCEGQRLAFQTAFREAGRQVPEWAELAEVASSGLVIASIGVPFLLPTFGLIRLSTSAAITAARRDQARRLLPLVRNLGVGYRQLGRVVEQANALARRIDPSNTDTRRLAELLARADVEGQRSRTLLEAWEHSGIGDNDPARVPAWRAYLIPEIRQAQAVARTAENHQVVERVRRVVEGDEYQRPTQRDDPPEENDDGLGGLIVLGGLVLIGAAYLATRGRR